MIKKRILIFSAILLLISVSFLSSEVLAMKGSDKVIPQDYEGEISYLIHPGDIIEVNVFGAPGMHNPPFHIRISEDGTVYFPLLGLVKLGGLTEVEATKKLDDLWAYMSRF